MPYSASHASNSSREALSRLPPAEASVVRDLRNALSGRCKGQGPFVAGELASARTSLSP
ncbi:hypothetical protein SGLAM104S_09168 [Streptomyces glaucescens]